jgi:hypothetical protein
MLRSYLRLVLFTAGLLIGVQIPGFISDYSEACRSASDRGAEEPRRL